MPDVRAGYRPPLYFERCAARPASSSSRVALLNEGWTLEWISVRNQRIAVFPCGNVS